MPTPFPGMDPYLENPYLWPDVHNSLIVAIRDYLAPLLRPRYFVSVEERVYTVESEGQEMIGRADISVKYEGQVLHEARVEYRTSALPVKILLPVLEEIRETFLEVRAVHNKQTITLLEVLSPTNKRSSTGRSKYLQKRAEVLQSATHLVEIDLLRTGASMPFQSDISGNDYRIFVSRAQMRPNADLYPFSIRQQIPSFPLPLLPGDDEPIVALNQILHDLYKRAGYDLGIDYRINPVPSLSANDAVWADELLQKSGLRP